MKLLIWILVAVLLIAHQDFWYWDDESVVFGFIPIGLFYHACLSLVAGAFWFIVCTFAWPEGLEDDFESAPESEGAV